MPTRTKGKKEQKYKLIYTGACAWLALSNLLWFNSDIIHKQNSAASSTLMGAANIFLFLHAKCTCLSPSEGERDVLGFICCLFLSPYKCRSNMF